MFFIKTKRNSRPISGWIKKTGKRRAIEFLKNANARLHFINIETVHFINQSAIAFVLLPGCFSFFTKLPGYEAAVKYGDDTAKQLTGITCSKNNSTKDKVCGISHCFDAAVKGFRHHFQPIAVPDSKYQIMFRVTFSGLFVHGYLILFIIPFVFFRRWVGFSEYVKFIFIRHYFLSLWGDRYAAHFFA